MSYPNAPGKLNIGSATMRYIPTIYSGKLLKKYYDATVLAAITNTDYEGEIRQFGDTVVIRSTPDMVIRDYSKGQTLVNDQPDATSQELLIDQGKYWSFVTDDLDEKQTDIKSFVDNWTTDAAEQLKITVDTAVLANIPTGAHASNSGLTAGAVSGDIDLGVAGTPVSLDKTNILDKFVDCGVALDELNVPESGRFIVAPPKMLGLLKKSDLRDASIMGDPSSALRRGVVGSIDRFTVYSSNLLAKSGAEYSVIFGHKDATTFATQLVKNKVQDNPNGFGMLHRGLQVYGYKVVKSDALGHLVATVA